MTKRMAPRSSSPDLERLNIRVPAPLLKQAKELAKAMGLSEGDFHRDVWLAGLYQLAEKHNKLLVNYSLRQKFQDMTEYIELEDEDEGDET
ncbi:MAG: hypothetical protein QNJ46_12690 [Leptolyngbyaceae cyanobacterium MO_188.B28]|nr:hypothetical protein [Leptolyngbyaceae cyanobacterium MO_188.B28]